MRAQLQFICNNCGLIFDELHERDSISKDNARYIQVLVNEIQSALDDLSNELNDSTTEED